MTKNPRTRDISRRQMLKMMGAGGAGLILPACSESPRGPAVAGKRVPIRLVVMDYDENMKADTQALIDAFNNSQKRIEASLDIYNWTQGHDQLVTQIGGGQAPDLANAASLWLSEWRSINEIMPLDDLLPPSFLDSFANAGLNAFRSDGRLMGLPYFLDPRAMYYRKDMFEAEGLPPPQTWADVVTAGLKLHRPPGMYGLGLTLSRKSDNLDYWWYAWFGVQGAAGDLSIWTEDGHSRLGSPEAIEATRYLVDLVQTHGITNPDYTTAGRDEELQPLFYAGKLAMLQTGSWLPTLLKNNAPELPYGIGPIPVSRPELAPANGIWPDCLVMFKQTPHPREAATLLRFLYSRENRLAFARQRGVIPERIDVGRDPAYAVTDVEKFFVEALATSHNTYETPWPTTLVKTSIETENLVGRAVAGEISAEEAMTSAARLTDRLNGLS